MCAPLSVWRRSSINQNSPAVFIFVVLSLTFSNTVSSRVISLKCLNSACAFIMWRCVYVCKAMALRASKKH